jgi:hypothetical protein
VPLFEFELKQEMKRVSALDKNKSGSSEKLSKKGNDHAKDPGTGTRSASDGADHGNAIPGHCG